MEFTCQRDVDDAGELVGGSGHGDLLGFASFRLVSVGLSGSRSSRARAPTGLTHTMTETQEVVLAHSRHLFALRRSALIGSKRVSRRFLLFIDLLAKYTSPLAQGEARCT